MKKTELLSPVGDFECLKAAVQNGADSVYLGANLFNARQRASNFDIENLRKAIIYSKLRDVNVHLTLNTLIKDSEFDDAVKLALEAYNLGVDAIIIQDLGLSSYLLANYPEIPLHASTQLTVHNLDGVKQMEELGFKRVVLSRELSIDEITHICQNSNIEIETFIHGALCISYSGQCLFSSMVGNRSGNRGLCAQPCRLPYELYNSSNELLDKGYLLNPRDLNGTTFLPNLIKAGVDCFKIEGRMKSPEYVSEVTKYYRKYIDLVTENIKLPNEEILKIIETEINKQNSKTFMTDKEELTQVFNRGGFSLGHLSNERNEHLISSQKSNNMGISAGKIKKINQNKGHLFFETKTLLNIGDKISINNNLYTISELMINGKNQKNVPKNSFVEIGRMKGPIKINDSIYKMSDNNLSNELRLTFENNKEYKKIPLTAIVTVKSNQPITLEVFGTPGTIYKNYSYKAVSNIFPEKALHSPVTEERILAQISKTGSTQFKFLDIKVNLDDNLFIPKISALNDLRRAALDGIENVAIKSFTRCLTRKAPNKKEIEINESSSLKKSTNISLLLNAIDLSFDYTSIKNIHRLYIPLRFFVDKRYNKILINICESQNVYLYMPNVIRDTLNLDLNSILNKFKFKGVVISNISQIKHFPNLDLIGNYTLNTFNTHSAQKLENLKISTYTISPELNKDEIICMQDLTSLQSELIVYGKIPLMTNNYCYLSKNNKCFKGCQMHCLKDKYYMKDRLGFKFPLLPDYTNSTTTIFNSKITSIKYLSLNIENLRIDILDEDPTEIQNIINKIKKGERFEGKEYTNGNI